MKNNLFHKTTLMKSLSLLQPKLPSIYTAKHGRNRAEKMRSREAERGMVQGEKEGGRAGVEWKWNMREREGGGKSKRGHSLSTFVYSEINRPCRTRYQRKRGLRRRAGRFILRPVALKGKVCKFPQTRCKEWLLSSEKLPGGIGNLPLERTGLD